MRQAAQLTRMNNVLPSRSFRVAKTDADAVRLFLHKIGVYIGRCGNNYTDLDNPESSFLVRISDKDYSILILTFHAKQDV